jgi:hypothetical protein
MKKTLLTLSRGAFCLLLFLDVLFPKQAEAADNVLITSQLQGSGPAVILVGNTATFTASGGNAPYTWTASSQNVTVTANGDGTTASVTGNTVSQAVNDITINVKDSVGNTGHTQVTVAQVTIGSLSFTSDHHVMTNYWDDCEDGGSATVYPKPDWTPGAGGTNNPITHTAGAPASLSLQLQVAPAGLPAQSFTVVGNCDNTGMDYNQTANLQGGANPPVAMTSSTTLPSTIGFSQQSIQWTFYLNGEESPSVSTGPHQIYLLHGQPVAAAGIPTGWRINWVTGICTGIGMNEYLKMMDAIHYTNGVDPKAKHPNPIWEIAQVSPGNAQCIDYANFDNAAIQMLGVAGGKIQYLYVNMNKGSFASNSQTDWVQTAGNNPNRLVYVSGNTINNWEGALLFNGKYYPGGLKSELSPQAVMNGIVGKSVWETSDSKYWSDAEIWDATQVGSIFQGTSGNVPPQ